MGRGITVGMGLPIKGGIVENTGGRSVVTGVSTGGRTGGPAGGAEGMAAGWNSHLLPAKGGLQAQSVPSAIPPFKQSGNATKMKWLGIFCGCTVCMYSWCKYSLPGKTSGATSAKGSINPVSSLISQRAPMKPSKQSQSIPSAMPPFRH